MTIDELIGLTEARLSFLRISVPVAAAAGDVARLIELEKIILETETTLASLRAISGLAATAN